MRTNLRIFSVMMLALACPSCLFAQAVSPSPASGVQQRGAGFRGPLANLTPQEREKLKAARQKAMQEPKVQDALENERAENENFRATMRAALLAADPSIGPIFDKTDSPRQQRAAGQPPAPGQGAFANLTPDEREKLKTAHDKIKDKPDVKAAQSAKTDADNILRNTLQSAMLSADPSLEPLLKKIGEFVREHPGARNWLGSLGGMP